MPAILEKNSTEGAQNSGGSTTNTTSGFQRICANSSGMLDSMNENRCAMRASVRGFFGTQVGARHTVMPFHTVLR